MSVLQEQGKCAAKVLCALDWREHYRVKSIRVWENCFEIEFGLFISEMLEEE